MKNIRDMRGEPNRPPPPADFKHLQTLPVIGLTQSSLMVTRKEKILSMKRKQSNQTCLNIIQMQVYRKEKDAEHFQAFL